MRSKMSKIFFFRGPFILVALWMIGLLFTTGCATTRKGLGTRFFPPAPEAPKIQFLKRISSSLDVEKSSQFKEFVTGQNIVKRFGKPYGVEVHDGLIYICDVEQGTVIILDMVNKSFDWLHDTGAGDTVRPINIAIDKDGTKYVADYYLQQIFVYDKDNRFKRIFGNKGQFKPTDVALFEDKLFVVDTRDHEVEVLDKKTGELLYIIGEPSQEEGGFFHPTNISIDKQGNLYVTDTINCRVQKFDQEGNFLLAIGQCGDMIGDFARPKGNAISPDGFIYVVDSAFENVQIFSPEGKSALFFGGWGDAMVPGALWLPAGITITTDPVLMEYFSQFKHRDFNLEYLVLVMSQYGPPYLNVYGFGNAREGSRLAKGEVELFDEEKNKPKSGSPDAANKDENNDSKTPKEEK